VILVLGRVTGGGTFSVNRLDHFWCCEKIKKK